MKKLKGRTILTLLLISTMTVGLAYGAIVNYISSQITKPVTVESPIELEGKITYQAKEFGPGTSTYSTTLAKLWWGQEPFDYTDEEFTIWDPEKKKYVHPEWDPTEITIKVAEGKITFTITMPTAFNPDAWVNDNFAVELDVGNDGVPDFQFLYNTIEDEETRPGLPHWASKWSDGSWTLEPIPDDWAVSVSADLKVFTVTMPVSYLGGMGSTYSFSLQVVKYIPDENADPLGYPWSTQSLVVINIPEEGYQAETVGKVHTRLSYVWTEVGDGVSAGLAMGDEFLYMKFIVEEQEETFLLVFMDTREGGTIYDYGETGSDIRADYMIVDPAAGAFGIWYLGKWLREAEDGYEGWSQPYDDIRTWNCEGFVAEESRTDGCTEYDFVIPLEDIEYNPDYGLGLLVQTGAGFANWVMPKIGGVDVTTETFDHEKFSETLHGGDEFSMIFNATNSANKPINVTLGIAIKSELEMTGDEIWNRAPTPDVEGPSGFYWVAAYDLGTIWPGQTVTSEEVTIQLAPDIAPGDYTIKIVTVWTDRLSGLSDQGKVDYIATAAETAPLLQIQAEVEE